MFIHSLILTMYSQFLIIFKGTYIKDNATKALVSSVHQTLVHYSFLQGTISGLQE